MSENNYNQEYPYGVPPQDQPPASPQQPYGQEPYGQAPYGQSYGEAPAQQPYGTPPQGDPYAQQVPPAGVPYGQAPYGQPYGYAQQGQWSDKSKLAAGLLGIFLGALGVHNFYLGNTGKAVAQLLITLLSLGMLSFISGLWGLIEGILILAAAPGTQWSLDSEGRALRPSNV